MKVLLINPPYPFEESPTPPFGLMSLGAFLIEKGFEVRIDDFIITPCTEENMKATIRDFNPDVIGATGVTMNVKKGLSILSKYRDLKPDAVFVMGGPHVTFDADAILRDNPFIDYIVRGEESSLSSNCSVRSLLVRTWKALQDCHSGKTALRSTMNSARSSRTSIFYPIPHAIWLSSASTGRSGFRSTWSPPAAVRTSASSASGAKWSGARSGILR
jgi:hypothetical protein